MGPKVPDFRGMTLRRVLEESSAHGLPVEMLEAPEIGWREARIRRRDPILPPGERVRVSSRNEGAGGFG